MCKIFIMSVYHTFSIIILFRFRQGLGNTLSLVPIGNRIMQHCCHFDNPALLKLSSALFSFGAFFCSRCTPLSLEDPLLRLSYATTLTELSSVMTECLRAYLAHCKTVQNSARNCRNHQLSKNDEQCTSLLRCTYVWLTQEFQAMPNAMNTPTF